VNLPPIIVTPPENQTAPIGADVTLQVAADGTDPLHYQWRFNDAPIAGATDDSFTRFNVTTNDAGSYSVVVTNVAGSASAAATLTVTPPRPGEFLSLEFAPDQGARLVITGEAGASYLLQASDDLSNWVSLGAHLNTNGVFEVADPETNQLRRFYRTRN
jgi:hypothetical protein